MEKLPAKNVIHPDLRTGRVVKCDYCHSRAELVSSVEVYGGRDYGPIYLCRPCKAWVGIHAGTDKPLGRLADAELRTWKQKAHAAFDPTWRRRIKHGKSKHVARNQAYAWLAKALGIPREECHIGMFDVAMCKRVVEVCAGESGQLLEAL